MKKNTFYTFIFILLVQHIVQGKTIDFSVKNFQLSSFSDGVGAVVNTSITIINLGDSIPPNTSLKYYFSKDTLVDNFDNQITSLAIDVSSYNRFPYTYSSSFIIPENISLGQYYILAQLTVKGNDIHLENNLAYKPFTVKNSDVDLKITDFYVDNALVATGSVNKLDIRVSNVGKTSSGYNKVYMYLSNDKILSSDDINLARENNMNSYFDGSFYIGYLRQLVSGEALIINTNFQIPKRIQTSNQYIIIQITNDGIDRNPNDNQIAIPIAIIPSETDIVVQNLKVKSKNPAQGGMLEYSCQIKNQGKTIAQNVSSKFILINANDKSMTELPSSFVYNLKPDSTQYIDLNSELPRSLASGNYILKVIATNILQEADTMNNTIEIPLKISKQDIRIIFDQKLSSYKFPAGNFINVTTNLTNTGSTDIASGLLIHYISKDTIIDSTDISVFPYPYTYYYGQPIDKLAADTSVDYTYLMKIDMPVGKYYLLTSLIMNGFDYNERKQAVSDKHTSFIVDSKNIDYSIEATNPVSLTFSSGTTYNLGFKLKNMGNSHSDGMSYIFISTDSIYNESDILLYGTYYYNDKIINPGEISIIDKALYTFPKLPFGNYYLLFKHDVHDDTNLSNNIDVLKIVLNSPDVNLLVSNLQASFDNNGTLIDFNYKVKNTGSTNSGYRRLYYYISTDTIYSSEDYNLYTSDYLLPIEAKDSLKVNFEVNLNSWNHFGDYYLFIVEDQTYDPRINFSYKPLASVKIQNSTILAMQQNDLEKSNLNISLYPNPANKSFSIVGKNELSFTFGEIKNQLGETVLNFNSPENINIENLTPGLYIVYLSNLDGITTKKLMIQ